MPQPSTQPVAPVDIANIALSFLGQEAVTSITDGSTTNGIVMGQHYDMIRRKLLREYIMNWSKRRVLISRTRTPAFDYADAYLLPPNGIRILSLGGNVQAAIVPNSAPQLDFTYLQNYDLEDDPNGNGTEVLCNNGGNPTLALRYIADITDVTKMDPCFVNVLAIHLGMNAAYQITKNKDDVTRLNEMLKLELPLLQSISGQENPPVRIEKSKFSDARRMGWFDTVGVASQYTTFNTTWT